MRLDGSSHQKFKITEDHVPDEVENVKIRIDGKFGEYSNVPLNLYGRILLPFREILKILEFPTMINILSGTEKTGLLP